MEESEVLVDALHGADLDMSALQQHRLIQV